MKLYYKLSIIFCLFTSAGFGQNEFKKGQFITNSDEVVQCYIKDIDWKNNPKKFIYRFSDSDDKMEGSIENVKQFEIFEVSKYLRKTVDIDRSGTTINKLSVKRNPEFKEETLFLKVLIDSDASLYRYDDGNLNRFFYSLNGSKVEQLVFKEYRKGSDKVAQNNLFRQQLLNAFKCENFTEKRFKNINYKEDDLKGIFQSFNDCAGASVKTINTKKKNNKDIINLRLKLGIAQSSLLTSNVNRAIAEGEFDNEMVFRIGAELEALMPFNNGKWSILIEPSYQSYSSVARFPDVFGNPGQGGQIAAKYTSFELPFGLRHYFFLTDDSKLFVNAFYALLFPIDSQIEYDSGRVLPLEKSSGQAIGFGYTYKNLGMEFRYEFQREILGNNFVTWSGKFNQIGLILSYQFF